MQFRVRRDQLENQYYCRCTRKNVIYVCVASKKLSERCPRMGNYDRQMLCDAGNTEGNTLCHLVFG
jgi:hypothetical protein